MSTETMSARRAGPVRGGSRRAAVVLVAMVAAAALGGAFESFQVLSRGASPQGVPAAVSPSGPFGVSQDVPVSFGAIAVEHVEKIKGLTAKDLSGMSHGVQNLVKAGKMEINASITMTNLTDAPVRYSPEQFQLLVGTARTPVSEMRANVRPGTLQPNAAIDGRLSFVVKASGQRLWLAFDDPGAERRLLIDLGRTGRQTPDSAFDRFHHQGSR